MNTTIRAFLDSGRRLQGTDGIRGPIDRETHSRVIALEAFIRQGRISPTFVELYCRAFARLCLRRKIVRPGDPLVFADDGRDFYGDKILRTAALQGFAEEGLAVRDLGVAPTPAAVIFATYAELRLAAILTASHNPGKQNGLKFFVDGFKLLPDGELSDQALTNEILQMAEEHVQPARLHRPPTVSRRMSIRRRAEGLDTIALGRKVFLQSVTAVLPQIAWRRAPVEVLFDPANGAGVQYGLDLLRHLGVPHRSINCHPDGDNINLGGGVALLEGHDRFAGKGRPHGELPYLPVVRELFKLGRRNGADRWTVALVLDGDADRGYLLSYTVEDDTVHVVSGDQLAYIQAAMDKYRGLLPLGGVFIASVDGDLMAPWAAQMKLRLRTRLACVGDKWLTQPAREGTLIAAAGDASGHVVRMLPISTHKGGMHYALTGNGIFAGLNVIAGVLAGEFPMQDVIRPFVPGFKAAAWTWNVDRSRFAPGSRVWNANRKIIEKCYKQALLRNPKLRHRRLKFQQQAFAEDPEMLYYALTDREDRPLAAIFVRVSGSERKIGIQIRGRRGFQGLFTGMLRALQANHLLEMKDSKLRETLLERRALGLLKQRGPLYRKDLLARLNRRIKEPATVEEFDAVLDALCREGRLVIDEWVQLPAAGPHRLQVGND